jgi:hypothetical protein
MGITVASFDLTLENSLIVANLILIIIAVFLLIPLRIANKKNKHEKEKQTELAGIADIKPEDFKLYRLDLNKEILANSVTNNVQSEDVTSGVEAQDTTETTEKIDTAEPETVTEIITSNIVMNSGNAERSNVESAKKKKSKKKTSKRESLF